MENKKEKITQEIVQLIEQLKEKVSNLEELGYNVEIISIPDSVNKNWNTDIKVYKPIEIIWKS